VRFPDSLSAADAAVFETFVVPRYLSLFGELALEMLLAGPVARVAHLGCRTGYPDRQILERIESGTILAADGSVAALELARSIAASAGGLPVEYSHVHELPLPVDGELYSHVIALHPVGRDTDRSALIREAYRLLYDGGQLLIALPLRGSFQELGDLLREYALKHDHEAFGDEVDQMMARRPSIETLAEQIEDCGFVEVDVEVRATQLVFDSGRAFVDDPITRFLIIPDLIAELGVANLSEPMGYLGDAIDRYWSEHKFELTLNVGCASARRP
jgi:SAM-dependent methyltransferase